MKALPLFAATPDTGVSGALVVFFIYMAAVILLAVVSHRILTKRQFLGEYFLGSRSLGVWAFALTFAATSASGGSFMGFPSKVYAHGWVVALWIGSYMVVPILVMGLLGKRINQFSRKTGAITIPDLLRDRFESAALGGLATFLIVFFMTFNLIAQFKAGSVILHALFEGDPRFERATLGFSQLIEHVPYFSGAAPAYLLCLLAFAIGVIIYTTYGGFRAVVWTDVLQGVVMVCGVVFMLPLAIYFSGGLTSATEKMAEQTPPRNVRLQLSVAAPIGEAEGHLAIPVGTWLEIPATSGRPRRVLRTDERADIGPGETLAVRTSANIGADDKHEIPAIEITTPEQIANIEVDELDPRLEVTIVKETPYAYGAGQKNVYTTGPGPSRDRDIGFLPLSLAVSFFFMWTFSGAGQPGNMVRQMAFHGSRTLRYGILTLCLYYSLIYFPLVLIFCCARVLLPGWEIEPDRIMPEMAKQVTSLAGYPWVAGLLVAAPFAAVMSTVDSFLLISSSAVVRDIYQRNINPQASQRTIKTMTYVVTLAIGTAAMLAAVNPPKYLQDIIIFTGSGLSTSFLVPVALSCYWRRFNKQGAIGAMLGGFGVYTMLYVIGYLQNGQMTPVYPLDFHPFMVAMAASLLAGIVVALCTSRPPDKLVQEFFHRNA